MNADQISEIGAELRRLWDEYVRKRYIEFITKLLENVDGDGI